MTLNEVLQHVGENRQLISIIRERQAKCTGHVLRHHSLLGDIIEGRISGERPSGTPHQKTVDWTIVKVNGKLYGHIQEKAHWREK